MVLNVEQKMIILNKAQEDIHLLKRGADTLWNELVPSLKHAGGKRTDIRNGRKYKQEYQQWKHQVQKKSKSSRPDKLLTHDLLLIDLLQEANETKALNTGEHNTARRVSQPEAFSNFMEVEYETFLNYLNADPNILKEDGDGNTDLWKHVTDILVRNCKTARNDYREVRSHFKEWISAARQKTEDQRNSGENKVCEIWDNFWTSTLESEFNRLRKNSDKERIVRELERL
ncbi:hypothetical protein Trydic_g11839 [Trypoxylus dichotomus]